MTAVLIASLGDPAAAWDGVSLVRIHPQDRASFEAASAVAREVWSEHPDHEGGIDLAVEHARLGELELIVGDYEVRSEDIGAVAAAEHTRLASRTLVSSPLGGSVGEPDFFDDFRDLNEHEAAWAEIAEALPELITRDQIGVSYEGRKIWVYEISTAPPDAPAVFINFGQHAREWITMMSATYFLTNLVESYPDSNELQELFSQVRVYIVPLVNPDGYRYTWTDDRFWRKNRRDGVGVDLNRNWSVAWGLEPGSSSDPEHGNYRGAGPFSEPETSALRAFMAYKREIVAHCDVHSYSQLVLYPLSYLSYEVPELQGKNRAWAEQQAVAMSELHGTEYVPLRGSELYPATGVAMDWGFGERDMMTFTYELRPGTDIEFPDGFVLPPEEIRPTCEEAEAGLYALIRFAADGGPEPVDPPPPNPPPVEEETGGTEGEVGTDGRPNLSEGGTMTGCACSSSNPTPESAFLSLGLLGLLRRRR